MGIVTKQVANGNVKAVLLAALSVLNGVVSSALGNDGIVSETTLSAAFVSFVVAVASYYGFLKPTGVAPAVQDKTAGVGIEKLPFM